MTPAIPHQQLQRTPFLRQQNHFHNRSVFAELIKPQKLFDQGIAKARRQNFLFMLYLIPAKRLFPFRFKNPMRFIQIEQRPGRHSDNELLIFHDVRQSAIPAYLRVVLKV